MSTRNDRERSITAPDGAPVADVRPHRLESHGHVRTDDYYWLRERESADVIAYLEAENAYTEAALAPIEDVSKQIYDECIARLAEDDTSVPIRDGDWVYYRRVEKGQNYAVLCRRPAAGVTDIAAAAENAADEQVMLDQNELAEGEGFFALGAASVSPDGNLLAYATDTVGRRIYTIRVKDLRTGAVLDDVIPDVTSNLEWANDSRTIFYAKQDPDTLRSYQIHRHTLGSPVSADALVFEEKNEEFSCYVSKTKSDAYLLITSSQTLESESRFLPADDPTGEWTLIAPRQGHLYGVTHHDDAFYVLTNWDAVNFRLMRAPVSDPRRENWSEVIPHRPDVHLLGIEPFENHVAISERSNGLRGIRITEWSFGPGTPLEFKDPAYVASVGANRDLDARTLRYSYASLTTPNSTYEIDLETRESRLLKQEEVGGGFDSAEYVSERLWATARDGAEVPISLVRHRTTARDGGAPLLLYGYGSYGASSDPWFRSTIVSLLDRGFIFAIAHVRGGSEMGRPWYGAGKLKNKMNSFTDFNDCAHFLIAEDYADPKRIYAQGGSAGGLLMGAIINLEPDLYDGILAAVPFVDVVTTMLDDSIPLTTFEYDEWGNPNIEADYNTMLAYSPYDQVKAADYPHMLVTTGLHDSQVQYWEPAKWVAKLRVEKTGDSVLLLKTNMEAGHGGASGRYRRFEEVAEQYAFITWLAGAEKLAN